MIHENIWSFHVTLSSVLVEWVKILLLISSPESYMGLWNQPRRFHPMPRAICVAFFLLSPSTSWVYTGFICNHGLPTLFSSIILSNWLPASHSGYSELRVRDLLLRNKRQTMKIRSGFKTTQMWLQIFTLPCGIRVTLGRLFRPLLLKLSSVKDHL